MKNRIIRIALFLSFFAIAAGTKAQQFIASIDHNSLETGDIVTVSYTLSGVSGSQFQPPAFTNFRIISGPNVSNSISIGSQVYRSSSYSYVLQAVRAGKTVLQPASIQVNGQKVYSNSLTLDISREQAIGQNKNPNGSTANSGDLFLMASANKTTAVRGEAIAVTYYLYAANNIRISAPTITGMPNFTGFWVENGTEPKQINASRQTYKGKQYLVYSIRKILLFPQKTGMLSVDPLEIECEGQMILPKKHDPSDPFSD